MPKQEEHIKNSLFAIFIFLKLSSQLYKCKSDSLANNINTPIK